MGNMSPNASIGFLTCCLQNISNYKKKMASNLAIVNNKMAEYERLKMSMSFDSAIYKIRELGGKYDPDFKGLDAYDQLMICEGLSNSIFYPNLPVISKVATRRDDVINENVNDSVNVNGMSNGPRKLHTNSLVTPSKKQIIQRLSILSYKTPPKEIASLLIELFSEWPSKEGHWLYISQHWTPKSILSCINHIVKDEVTGRKTIINFSALFTSLVKHRKRRAVLKYT